jgi:hypothetical protein
MKPQGLHILIICVTIMGCTKPNANQLPVVEVKLNEPAITIKGITWDQKPDGSLADAKCVQSPCEVKISFPGGQAYSTYTKILFVDAQHDKVWIVNISPYEHALPYSQAVTRMAGIVADIELLFAVSAEHSVQKIVLGWKPKIAPWDTTKSTRIELDDRVSLVIQLRESDSGVDTWYASLSFVYEGGEH